MQYEKFVDAQQEYCKQKNLPMFIPEDGRCWSCYGNIFRPPYGFTLEYASSHLITRCPHCATSFCE